MALRLFRTTGYSTLMAPGETRLLPHPGWLVVATSLWLGIACNVAVWRLFANPGTAADAAASTLLLVGGSMTVLSLLGWRRTLKPAATLLLLGAGLAACGMWIQELPPEALWQQRPRALLPGWPDFLRWQVPALVLLLALAPIAWIWSVPLRRLPGPDQLHVNIMGMLGGAAVFIAGLALLR